MREAVTAAVAFQRELHIREEEDAQAAIMAQGCAMVELIGAEHDAFAAAVKPLTDEARGTYGRELFDLAASGK
jgi:TRAP-type C4-dicarboxylate transport system substrate-binding protein